MTAAEQSTAADVGARDYRIGVLTHAGCDELVITASSGEDAFLAASSAPDVVRVDTVSAVIDRR